jgi:DNA helicase-2/ATP-dependent DNA helicase PcrA
MAPPGSGKTFVIEHRYQYLIQNGVSPSEILVVTFSKKMADEMLERISRTSRKVEPDQISTIHAFCYRLLTRWDKTSQFFGWAVPKDWQVKKVVDELIDKIWKYEDDEDRPGSGEILTWIGNSKYHGLTVEESRQYFVENLGAQFGDWLYYIRKGFDQAMANQKFMLFADMLYHTEQRLKNDVKFRELWQSRFSQVIIDEGQDTNYQAMRILITLSLEPGNNPIYS